MFGETAQWGDSLRPFLWTHTATMVTAFESSTEFDLPVVCSYDFDVAADKYLHSLDDGMVPLALCFSGTAFSVDHGRFRAEPKLQTSPASEPRAVWRETMDLYFPNSGWIRLDRATLDALTRFKAHRALPTWELAIEQLLKEAGEPS